MSQRVFPTFILEKPSLKNKNRFVNTLIIKTLCIDIADIHYLSIGKLIHLIGNLLEANS
jgi:hypothetical protein